MDISNWDTSHVENMGCMFGDTRNLQHIIFGPNFVHNESATTSKMFLNCGAPERPTGDSWTDVSYD